MVPSFGASGSAEIDGKNYYTKTKQKANKTHKKISMDKNARHTFCKTVYIYL